MRKLTLLALQTTVHYDITYQYHTTTEMFDSIDILQAAVTPNNKNNGRKQQLR